VSAAKAEQATTILDLPSSAVYGTVIEIAASGGSGAGAWSFAVVDAASCRLVATDVATAEVEMTTGAGNCGVTATRAADDDYLVAAVLATTAGTPATLAIDAVAAERVYGVTDPAMTWTLSGFVLSDTATTVAVTGLAECARVAGETVGAYPTTCAAGTLASVNYQFATGASSTLEITPRALAITASGGRITAGAALPAITPSYVGLASFDTATATPPTCTTAARSVAGTYATTCAGAADANYTITYVSGSLVVDAAPVVPVVPKPVVPVPSGPSPTPSASPTPTPTPTASASPTPTPTATDAASEPDASGDPESSGDDTASVLLWVLGGVLLLALVAGGILLIVRRRGI
jgi:hypothetical protein